MVTTSPFLKYSAEVRKLVCPLIGSPFDSPSQIKHGKSKITNYFDVEDLQSSMIEMEQHFLNNEDSVFNIPVQVEEIKRAIKSLPEDKAARIDGVISEHLKFASESLNIWILQIFKAII